MFRQQLRHLCQQHSHPHGPSKWWQPCQDPHRAGWALAEDLSAQLIPEVESRREEERKVTVPGVPGSWLRSRLVCPKLLCQFRPLLRVPLFSEAQLDEDSSLLLPLQAWGFIQEVRAWSPGPLSQPSLASQPGLVSHQAMPCFP